MYYRTTHALALLIALFLVIVVGAVKPKVNIGMLSIVVALMLGMYLVDIPEKEIISLFPSNLFLMLIGVTTLFAIANNNGALQVVTNKITLPLNSKPHLLPVFFFFITFFLAASGPGNIAAVAIVAPLALAAALKHKLNMLLMIIIICTGANAGAFSPLAPTGVILLGLMHKIGIDNTQLAWLVFLASAIIQSMGALLAYIVLKGYRAHSIRQEAPASTPSPTAPEEHAPITLSRDQRITLAVLGLFIISVAVLQVSITLASFLCICILFFLVDTTDIYHKIPMDAIMLVVGVTVLIGVLDRAGSLDLAVQFLSTFASEQSINALLALITGAISTYSSSSGVVMPAFIPLVPKLATQIPGADMSQMLIAISVGSHMVDVSPLSTLGAICIATVQDKAKHVLFRQLMLWGFSMALVGALLSFIILDVVF